MWKCPYYENTQRYGSARAPKQCSEWLSCGPMAALQGSHPLVCRVYERWHQRLQKALGRHSLHCRPLCARPHTIWRDVIVVHRSLVFFSKGRSEETWALTFFFHPRHLAQSLLVSRRLSRFFLKRVWLLPGYSPSVTPVFMLRRYLGCHSNREQPGGKENALGFIFCLQIFITRKRFFANKYVCIIYMMIKFDNEQILIKQPKLYFFYSK